MFDLSEFTYDYPEELIAQIPVEPRRSARLLVVQGEGLEHRKVHDLPDLLPPNTLVVLNDARVLPARLLLERSTGGKVEALLLGPPGEGGEVEALLKPARRVKPGEVLLWRGQPALEILAKPKETAEAQARLVMDHPLAWLMEAGKVPLPPYIADNPSLYDRYQTVFSQEAVAVAAPTAGLHLDEEVLADMKSRGHEICSVTLAVGAGTFAPIKTQDVRAHRMHEESFVLSEDAAQQINAARTENRVVLAVGTTALRVLESCFDGEKVVAKSSRTGIFLHPENPPRLGASLMTNFHFPETSLLVLLASILPTWKKVYEEAVRERYRLFSFGDAMIVLRRSPLVDS